jgi:hypothetical protein
MVKSGQTRSLHPPARLRPLEARARQAENLPHPLLRFQREMGNQAVLRSLHAGSLQRKCASCEEDETRKMQTKLAIHAAGDVYEQEADRVADAVVNGGVQHTPKTSAVSAGIQRCSCTEASSETAGSTAPSAVSAVLDSSGDALQRSVRENMEGRFGHDFSGVRIHTDARAAESARSVNALAYTVGNHVVFGRGQYAPSSRSGQHLLAHELAHTVQQSKGATHGIQRYKVTDCDPKENPLELPSTVHDAHKRAMDMLNNAITRSANRSDPDVVSAAQTYFNITLPPPNTTARWKDSFAQYLWARARKVFDGMKTADTDAVYECEPKQNWWNGLCVKDNDAVSLDNIHLCPQWWRANPSLNCRASILFHEWAHKWGPGVNRVFDTYFWETTKFQKLKPEDRIKMPDAFAGYAYMLFTGNPWNC